MKFNNFSKLKTVHSLNLSDCNMTEDENNKIVEALEVKY